MAGYCSLEGTRYRGSWAAHAATQRHRLAVHRHGERLGSSVGRRRRPMSAALLESRRRHAEESMVRVEDYYRNPPTPPWPARIRDRVWYVVRHWRRPPGTLSGSSRIFVGSHHRRRRRRRAA